MAVRGYPGCYFYSADGKRRTSHASERDIVRRVPIGDINGKSRCA
jgi:hypothetical protein